jgi:NAD+ diphosphatase
MKKEFVSPQGINRFCLERNDKTWLTEAFHNENCRIIPVYNLEVLCDTSHRPKAVYLASRNLIEPLDSIDSMIFLGIYEQIPYFAAAITSEKLAQDLGKQMNAGFRNLRAVLSLLDYRDSQILTLARFMSYWHVRNRYCGKCGSRTTRSEAGHVRICRNNECKEHYFPSMDPAIIVLISSGARCLLGRKKEWPEGMYSTLAGFVEPGETAEEAVIREVREESGISVDQVEYQHSQSWLFPGSLMLGFCARARDEKIIVNPHELEDARWFTREDIRGTPNLLPTRVSISYRLIMEWFERGE